MADEEEEEEEEEYEEDENGNFESFYFILFRQRDIFTCF